MQQVFRTHTPWEERLNGWIDRYIPPGPDLRHTLRVKIFRVIAITNILLGVYYLYYRYTDSVNPYALWIAIPLLLAETYSFIDTVLFIFMMWQPKQRVPPPPPDTAHTVDVFITTYSEPVELVRKTAEAALKIRYPHQTYVLDDGSRPEMQAICKEMGCGYLTRDPDLWKDVPRHAKAGNVINAMSMTSGDFILILDADQIPSPEILDRVLGYFADPQVAFVQTPQYFYNVPADDPFGSRAPLFYGPIQQGKDGWNAAFFCGSNAVLRREALMQLGVSMFVTDTENRLKEYLCRVPLEIATLKWQLSFRQQQAGDKIAVAAQEAVIDLNHGRPLAEVTDMLDRAIAQAQREIIADNLTGIQQDLAEVGELAKLQDSPNDTPETLRQDLEQGMLMLETDNLGLRDVLAQIQLNIKEAFEVQPLATYSITEDMATAMRLHALNWKSVFYPQVLVYGLAPEDLGSTLGQRLRWGAGTIQVLLHENPLLKPGLNWPQRLQYFTTMYSYFSGFAGLVYLIAPIIYLFTGIAPVTSYAGEFLWRIIPYLLINKLMFKFVAWGIDVKRGEQYSLALFPLWIQAVLTVFGGQKLSFKVTPKTRQSGVFLNLVIPQLAITILLILGCSYALFGLAVGWRSDWLGVWVNIFWAGYDIWLLSVILKAAVYRPATT